jgi:hypothetical protein
MRAVHWLFLLSLALFVCGVGFVIAAGRSPREAPRTEAPPTVPVASVKQIMNGIVGPAATVVFGSVGTTITLQGTEEREPRTDEDWEALRDSAAALAEAGNMMMLGSRAVDKGDWIRMSRALIDAATLTLKAADAKSPADVFNSAEVIYNSCNTCHMKYQRG